MLHTVCFIKKLEENECYFFQGQSTRNADRPSRNELFRLKINYLTQNLFSVE